MWFMYGNTSRWLKAIDDLVAISRTVNNFVKYKTNRIIGETLRGRITDKLKSRRRVWDIIISADELTDSAKLSFLANWWNSGLRHYINLLSPEAETPVTGWIEVVIPGDVIPLEFLEGEVLPEFTITLEEEDGGL